MTASINLPIAVPVSSGSAPDIASTLSETFLPSSRATISSKIADRPRQPVQLGHGEGVALADVIQSRLKLLALSDR